MGIVFDEIVTEVRAPVTREAPAEDSPAPNEATDAQIPRAALQQALEHLKTRQLRLMAD